MSAQSPCCSNKKPDLAAVQEYTRQHPEVAIEYLAALVKENFKKLQPRGFFARLGDMFKPAAEVCSGRARMKGLWFRSFLEKREPVIGHALLCSDPLMEFFLEDSSGFLGVSRRVGAWPGENPEHRESLNAEISLFRSMGAPNLFVIEHYDSTLVAAKNDSNCGCAAISVFTGILGEHVAGKAVWSAPEKNAKIKWIKTMRSVAPAALAEAKEQGSSLSFHWLQRHVRRMLLHETTEIAKGFCNADFHEGGSEQNIIRCVLDQGTGELWGCEDEIKKTYKVVVPRRSLQEIEHDLFRISMGKAPLGSSSEIAKDRAA